MRGSAPSHLPTGTPCKDACKHPILINHLVSITLTLTEFFSALRHKGGLELCGTHPTCRNAT